MKKTHLVVLAAVVAAVAGGTSAPAQTITRVLGPPAVVACPSYVLPDSVAFQAEWTVVSPQGWLDKARVENGLIYCDYGIDRAKPADRPAFRIRRVPPAGYGSCVVAAGGTSVSCSPLPPVVKAPALP